MPGIHDPTANAATGAAGPGAPGSQALSDRVVEHKLYFTRDDKREACRRILIGTLLYNLAAFVLLVTLNVGGSVGVNSAPMAEDGYVLSWTRSRTQPIAGTDVDQLVTFNWYLNGLCFRQTSGSGCLYRQAGQAFDSEAIQNAINGYFPNGTLDASPRYYRSLFADRTIAVYITGIVVAAGSWVCVLASDRTSADSQLRARLWELAALGQLAGAGLFLAGTIITDSTSSQVASSLHGSTPFAHIERGWSFLAVAYSAFAAQAMAVVLQGIWVAVRRSEDRAEPQECPPDFDESQAEHLGHRLSDNLPSYARHDPMGRPPSIGGTEQTHRGGDVELGDLQTRTSLS